jgi:hypothetical protein
MVRPLRPQGVGSHRKGNHVVPVEARLDGRLNLSQLKEQIDQTEPKLEIPFEQFLKSFLVNLAGETATADETRRGAASTYLKTTPMRGKEYGRS